MARIGVNGFGRIGRLLMRVIKQYHNGKIEVVAINDLTDAPTNTHLMKWDTCYGRYPGDVSSTADSIVVDGRAIKVISERDPARIPWKDFGADIVIESTGAFTDATRAVAHRQGGAQKVIISAPAKNEDITLVMGVNEESYVPEKHHVISNASCTTNCVAPVARVLQQSFGINKGLMSTIHAYTNDQRLQDMYHKDLRRARAAAENIVPTTTGAAKAIGQVMPELKGRLHGLSFRVPVATVSIVDLVCELGRDVTIEEVNAAFKSASEGAMKGIMEYCTEPLVSADFRGNPASSIVDSLSTMVIGGNMVKVMAWYDNEWGYCCRLADLAFFIANKGF